MSLTQIVVDPCCCSRITSTRGPNFLSEMTSCVVFLYCNSCFEKENLCDHTKNTETLLCESLRMLNCIFVIYYVNSFQKFFCTAPFINYLFFSPLPFVCLLNFMLQMYSTPILYFIFHYIMFTLQVPKNSGKKPPGLIYFRGPF